MQIIKLTARFVSAAIAMALASAAIANTVLETETDGGAIVKIEMPDNWNGSLVIYNHGFDLGALVPSTPSLGPLASVQLSQGYAVAASSYQQNGWALYKTKNDLQNLMDVFKDNFGKPGEVYLHGFSLGGIVTAQGIEKASLGNVVGAYPACGAMAGSRSWDGALDLRLVYDAICASVPGAEIPGGSTGLPARFTEYPFSQTDMALAINACFGLLTPPGAVTPEQQARLQLFLDETDLPASFILTDMGFSVFGLSDLIFDTRKLNGKQGMGNVGVQYDNASIETTIERVKTHPGGLNRHTKNYEPTGDVGNVKIVSTHTSGDGLVIVEQQQVYRDLVPASNLTVAVVNEAPVETHCGYTVAELVAGWEALRGWVAGAPQPTAASIQATCQGLVGANIPGIDGPCRYDPAFVIENMDDRVPPR